MFPEDQELFRETREKYSVADFAKRLRDDREYAEKVHALALKLYRVFPPDVDVLLKDLGLLKKKRSYRWLGTFTEKINSFIQ